MKIKEKEEDEAFEDANEEFKDGEDKGVPKQEDE